MPDKECMLNKYLLNEWLNSYSMCCGPAQSVEGQKNGSSTIWMMIQKEFQDKVTPESRQKTFGEVVLHID